MNAATDAKEIVSLTVQLGRPAAITLNKRRAKRKVIIIVIIISQYDRCSISTDSLSWAVINILQASFYCERPTTSLPSQWGRFSFHRRRRSSQPTTPFQSIHNYRTNYNLNPKAKSSPIIYCAHKRRKSDDTKCSNTFLLSRVTLSKTGAAEVGRGT